MDVRPVLLFQVRITPGPQNWQQHKGTPKTPGGGSVRRRLGSTDALICSINVNALTLPNATELEQALQAIKDKAGAWPLLVAVQSHCCDLDGDLLDGTYAPWLTKCPVGPGGHAAGGVGWLVKKGQEHMVEKTPSSRAPNEGAHLSWVTLKMQDGSSLDCASCYVPPGGTHDGRGKAQVT